MTYPSAFKRAKSRASASTGSGDLSMKSSFYEIGTAIFKLSVQLSIRIFTGNGTFFSVYTSKNSLFIIQFRFEKGWGKTVIEDRSGTLYFHI